MSAIKIKEEIVHNTENIEMKTSEKQNENNSVQNKSVFLEGKLL